MKVLFVILSGGKGTRLRPVTFFWQKTLLPTKRRRRIIDYALESTCNTNGLTAKTIVLARYKSRQVARYVKQHYPNVTTLVESLSLDTGGAMLQHWNIVREYRPELLVVLNGDHYIQLPIFAMIGQYYDKGEPSLMLIGIKSNEPHHDYINIRFDRTKFLNKFPNRKSPVAYTGIFMAKFEELDAYMKNRPMKETNMTRDIVRALYESHGADCFLLTNEWDDLGTWPRYVSSFF